MKGKYAEWEREGNGTYTVFNNVTGLLVKEGIRDYKEAKGIFDMLTKHYTALEKRFC